MINQFNMLHEVTTQLIEVLNEFLPKAESMDSSSKDRLVTVASLNKVNVIIQRNLDLMYPELRSEANNDV